jgi:hypothetical protein
MCGYTGLSYDDPSCLPPIISAISALSFTVRPDKKGRTRPPEDDSSHPQDDPDVRSADN